MREVFVRKGVDTEAWRGACCGNMNGVATATKKTGNYDLFIGFVLILHSGRWLNLMAGFGFKF